MGSCWWQYTWLKDKRVEVTNWARVLVLVLARSATTWLEERSRNWHIWWYEEVIFLKVWEDDDNVYYEEICHHLCHLAPKKLCHQLVSQSLHWIVWHHFWGLYLKVWNCIFKTLINLYCGAQSWAKVYLHQCSVLASRWMLERRNPAACLQGGQPRAGEVKRLIWNTGKPNKPEWWGLCPKDQGPTDVIGPTHQSPAWQRSMLNTIWTQCILKNLFRILLDCVAARVACLSLSVTITYTKTQIHSMLVPM